MSYITVRVFAGSKKEKINRIDDNEFEVQVKEPAQQNLANTRVRQMIAGQLGVRIEDVRIISGHHSQKKILSVNDKP